MAPWRSRRARAEKLLYRAGALAVDGRTDRAVTVYDELVARYDADPDPETRRVVALALFAKALTLAKADRFDEAITACEVAIARYRNTSVPELSDRVIEALPVKQKAHEVRRRHRLDLAAQLFQGIAMDAREQAPFAPLGLRSVRTEAALQHETLLFQFGKGGTYLGCRESQMS